MKNFDIFFILDMILKYHPWFLRDLDEYVQAKKRENQNIFVILEKIDLE